MAEQPVLIKHTVVEGDTLSGIARHYYLDASKWPRIWRANIDVICKERWRYEARRNLDGSPWDLIFPGTQLGIPEPIHPDAYIPDDWGVR